MAMKITSKPSMHVFRLHSARPMELLAMCQANAQFARDISTLKDTRGRGLIGPEMEQLAKEAAWRSYRDALRERKEMTSFWSEDARKAAKGQLKAPVPKGSRPMLYNGGPVMYNPETHDYLTGKSRKVTVTFESGTELRFKGL